MKNDSNKETIIIMVDGACKGNPGNTGIGVVLITNENIHLISQNTKFGTNNTAELKAAICALELLKTLNNPILMNQKNPDTTQNTTPKSATKSVTLYTDSQLVEGFANKAWNPKANKHMVRSLRALLHQPNTDIDVVKIKAHSTETALNELHNIADELAKKGSRGINKHMTKPRHRPRSTHQPKTRMIQKQAHM